MNEKKTGSWSMIIGGIALIIVLFIGVQVIFWVLEEVIHQDAPAVSAVQSVPDTGAEAPGFCVHCGEELPDSFQWGQYCPWCGEKIEQ
ncbi:MAG: zinc ribbon domain-containing protein [Lawsonibacter sp.]|jgi:hypothetical protein|nr:zinc ribbon domain-containing protein [Lawsonibacter sp.]MCI9027831.1 zinc ribbon domain-containing protein [Lawsonibacter sp.]MCI9295109.1 zinc ribbon domain-containing protein [Lawsonibacter sp.]MCI9656297.1 zinc ribbon domain-containing protein [Lawsonibacter sp.]